MREYEEELRDVVRAWETLPRGHHSPRVVQQWMRDELHPAICRARDALGLPNTPPRDLEENS
jgi:hypothetical protein